MAASGMPLVLVERMVPGVRRLATLRQQAALDVEILGDGFDDPVAVRDVFQIVFEITRRDEFRSRLG